ncbi:flagellar biosynthetic protein FliO [uncultured Ferrovibrio sp.]|jgi:Flagellar biogenesis protein|uniref:flagellar biosynthetic protein FliO n=1 Tax=uncultured Ferrovibrio sp. TaxID=1576913 RepID=UPI00262532D8|nr:flagellar biosynthetic protein FliO [uncultured Ferrovibrio sp.]
MNDIDYSQIALAFGGLLVLLGLFYYAMRVLSGSGRFGKWRQGQRIGVVEMAPVDGSRRLVLVRRDDTEHLLLLSGEGDLVIESGIPVERREALEPESGGSWPSFRIPGRDRDG